MKKDLPTKEDGSSVRTKVAQYYVDQKLKKLDSQSAYIKARPEDLNLLHSVPQYEDYESEVAQGRSGLEHGVAEHAPITHSEPPELPPIYAPGPEKSYISWNDLFNSFSNLPVKTPKQADPQLPPWFRVAIIGAGVAGLRTAMLLQDMGIPYEIFEASDRIGGRIFTYEFASKPPGNPQGKHDYYDVGAMRFPDNNANKLTFELFKELGLSEPSLTESKNMNPYVLSRDNNIYLYNNIKSTAVVAKTAGDHFDDGSFVPQEYLDKKYTDPWKNEHEGVNACTFSAYDSFRKDLIDNFEDGWENLMKYDWASTRSFLAQELKPQPYPLSVIHWMETRDAGTGAYDGAFSEDILDSLEFSDPTKDVKWWCLEGGSKIFIDAMVDTLTTKPSTGCRVTSVKQVSLSPDEWFPDYAHQQPQQRLRPPRARFPFMEVNVDGKEPQYFAHVVSTSSFASLRTIDTEGVTMTYKQRQAIRTLRYSSAIKVAIRFTMRWWEQGGLNQLGGRSPTDRQSRQVVYPSYGLEEAGPGVLLVSYNWHQDASRYGALIEKSDWSEQLDPDRERPFSEKLLLEQIYEDLAALHGVTVGELKDWTLDYHAFDWYHSPFTMGAYANFAPGQFSTFFPDIVESAGYGRFHFAGEVASHHHGWVAGALDSAVRVVEEIERLDFPHLISKFEDKYGRCSVFSSDTSEVKQWVRGLFSKELDDAGF